MPERINGIKRIMALVIILFFILPSRAYLQCKEQHTAGRSVVTEDVSNGTGHYFQNLIIQDIAISSQRSFKDISLEHDYIIHYQADHCRKDRVEIRVLPVEISCSPVSYQDFDISSSIRPEKADLVFYLTEQDGFISDSIVFFDIPVGSDHELYTSLAWMKNDTLSQTGVSFARAVFHYTKSSYDLFRDRLLEIDNYYAASYIADSTMAWARSGFLAESAYRPEMTLRQSELQRIISHIDPDRFRSWLTTPEADILGLRSKYQQLIRLNARYKAILTFDHLHDPSSAQELVMDRMLSSCLDIFDYYDRFAFRTDFRYLNFIESLAAPGFTNSWLASVYKSMQMLHDPTPVQFRHWTEKAVLALINRGEYFKNAGNQIRAEAYFSAAYDLSVLLNSGELRSKAFALEGNIKQEIAVSYTEISRKAALSGNPALAMQYLISAKNIFNDKDFVSFEPEFFAEYQGWLMQNFENQATRYIDQKKFRKAFSFLIEIENQCIHGSAGPCPDNFLSLMRLAREGIYQELLNRSRDLLKQEEEIEAAEVFRQAVGMRFKNGYMIPRQKLETDLESEFRQIRYEELIDEGLNYIAKNDHSAALFYFNKAYQLERSVLSQTDPRLVSYRTEAARQVMLKNLSEGRIRAWAYDFEGAAGTISLVGKMISDYEIGEHDSLYIQYKTLEANVSRKECEKILEQFDHILLLADSAHIARNYILSLKYYNDAINLSLGHLDCRIKDSEAWYRKVTLEIPAGYQKMEQDLETLAKGDSCEAYLGLFQKLKSYYYRHKLLQEGVALMPLSDRISQINDTAFLVCMLHHYIMVKDLNQALRLLTQLQETGLTGEFLRDEQKSLGASIARRDARDQAVVVPWDRLNSYTNGDRWFRPFSSSYKLAWLKAAGWKLRYWPLIWKK